MNTRAIYMMLILVLVLGLGLVPVALGAPAANGHGPAAPGDDGGAAAIAASPMAPAVGPATVYVRTDGNDANCDGTANTPYPGAGTGLACAFKTIQQGATSVGAGGTVNIAVGTYLESNIAIPRAMTIVGASRAGVIVGPAIADTKEDSSWGGTYSYGFLLQKPSVTIRNLTIDGNANSHDHDFRAAVMTDHRTGEVFDNIIVQDVTVLHTNRRAIQIFSNKSTRSVGDIVTGNIVTDVTIGPGIIFFDADGEISHNTVSGITTMTDGSAIEGVQWSTSGGMLLDIHGNTMSGVHTGIQIVVPRGGTSIVGNTMALAGGTDGDIGVLVRNANGEVTVQGNQITGSAKDAGIWMFGNAVAVMVTGNTLQVLRQRGHDSR